MILDGLTAYHPLGLLLPEVVDELPINQTHTYNPSSISWGKLKLK